MAFTLLVALQTAGPQPALNARHANTQLHARPRPLSRQRATTTFQRAGTLLAAPPARSFRVECNAYRNDAPGEQQEAGEANALRHYPWPADTVLSHLVNGIVAYEELTSSLSSADLVGAQLSKVAASVSERSAAPVIESQEHEHIHGRETAAGDSSSVASAALEAVVINVAFEGGRAEAVTLELTAEEGRQSADAGDLLEGYLRTLELHRSRARRTCISAFTTGLDERGMMSLAGVRTGASLSPAEAEGSFESVRHHLQNVALDERRAFAEFVLGPGDYVVLTLLAAVPAGRLPLPDPRRGAEADYEAAVLAALRRAAAGGSTALGGAVLRNGSGPSGLHAHVWWRRSGAADETGAVSRWIGSA